MSLNTKGSIWRKWDLQVQTRTDQNYTCLGSSLPTDKLDTLMRLTGLSSAEITSQEKSMSADKYAKLLVHYVGAFTDIKVIAVTDHNDGKELDYLIDEATKSDYDLTILPGVEVASSHGIHMLCIFDLNKRWKNTWAESIDHFLTEIGLTTDRFNTNGQPLDATIPSQDILEATEAKGGVCIFAHINTGRGLFVQSNTANGGNAHSDIYKHRYCQVVQIPHSANLPAGVSNIIEGRDPQYGNKKVTKIKCSDARKLSDIGSNFTWIKADSGLIGLKQIIYEPNLRSRIQAESPYEDYQKLALSELAIADGNKFKISNQNIPLNRDLVTIIGGRGSGKSLLLETIASINEEHAVTDVNGKPKVIESLRRSGVEAKISLILTNKDGSTETFSKDLTDTTPQNLPILYIGQEKLSSIATDDEKLTPTIRSFLGIKSDSIETEKIEGIINHDLAQIERFNEAISGLKQKYEEGLKKTTNSLPELLKSLREQKEKQIKRLTSAKTEKLVQNIRDIIDQGQKINNSLERLPALSESLDNINLNKTIESANKAIKELKEVTGVEIPAIDTSKQKRAIEANLKLLEKKRAELKEAYQKTTQELKELGVKEDVRVLTESIKKLQDEINEIDEDFKAYENYLQELNTYRDELKAMGKALENLVDWKTKAINEAFAEFKNASGLSDEAEQELFNSIIEGVSVEGEVVFDEERLFRTLIDECFDGRTFKDLNSIREKLTGKSTDEPLTFGDFIKFWKTGSIWDVLDKEKFNKNGRENFLDIIFKRWEEYIIVRTKISLDGVPIENLSVGQRGTLLLKIYLASATDKQIFIIDQPEDNLDNKFITEQMVPMLRKIKQSRQVILSTHNANIVVGCDADQIIVARLDERSTKDRTYISGGIESQEINHYIQEILEGGSKALARRHRRYV